MFLKKIGGKYFLVNLLSDFIVSKIGQSENTIIKVVDCENFFVVKGKTSSKQVLDLSSVISEFCETYHELLNGKKITHSIDLIQYESKLEPVEEIKHRYYNSELNCSYHYKEIDDFENIEEDDLVYISSFPHGYSLPQGRLLYYYGKKIFYNIPPNFPVTSLTLTLSTEKDSDGDAKLIVFNEFSKSEDETLRSAILDMFDFDLQKFEAEMKKVDWSIELTNPLSDHDFLKEKIKDFIII